MSHRITYLLEKLRELDIVSKESVEFKHGGKGRYIDIKKASGYSEVYNLLCDELYEVMMKTNRKINCVAANGYGGLPLAQVISSRHNLRAVHVRESPKKHGRGGYFEGHVPNRQDFVAIVDDVANTGRTFESLITRIAPTGAEIVGCYVAVKRNKIHLSIPLYHLFTSEDLLS